MAYFGTRGFVRDLERYVNDRRISLEIAARIHDGESLFNHAGYFVVRHSFLQGAVKRYLRESGTVGYFSPWLLTDASGLPSRMFEILQENGEFEVIEEIMERYFPGLVRAIMRGDTMGLFATYDGDWYEGKVPSGQTFYVTRTG